MATPVAYRRMPARYVAVWVVLAGLAALYQQGLPHHVGAFGELAITALLGGLLWGWILWRVGLYKSFPNL
jgi:hypothetical protein